MKIIKVLAMTIAAFVGALIMALGTLVVFFLSDYFGIGSYSPEFIKGAATAAFAITIGQHFTRGVNKCNL